MQVTVHSRVPIPFTLLQSLVLIALDLGLQKGKRCHLFIIMSVLLRVGFYALLRPGEIFGLRRAHVQIVMADNKKVAIISIISPKTRRVFGRSQYVLVSDVTAVLWLEWLIEGLSPSIKLWPGDGVSFRRILSSKM